MSARDELARDIFVADNSNAKDPAANWQEGPASIRDYAYAIADGLLAAGYRKAPEPEIEWGTRTKWGSRAAINRENAVDYIQLCDLSNDWAVLIKREAASQPGPWEDA